VKVLNLLEFGILPHNRKQGSYVTVIRVSLWCLPVGLPSTFCVCYGLVVCGLLVSANSQFYFNFKNENFK
jgi:hypothetical protein